MIGDRWGYTGEVTDPEKQEYKLVGSVTWRADQEDWGHGGERSLSGEYYQDTNFDVTPKNEATEKGKGNMVVLYRPTDTHVTAKYYYVWAMGRMFPNELDKVNRVEKSKEGLLVVSARGKNAVWQNNGRWNSRSSPTRLGWCGKRDITHKITWIKSVSAFTRK